MTYNKLVFLKFFLCCFLVGCSTEIFNNDLSFPDEPLNSEIENDLLESDETLSLPLSESVDKNNAPKLIDGGETKFPLLSTIELNMNYHDIQNNYIFTTSSEGGLTVYNLANPTSPQKVFNSNFENELNFEGLTPDWLDVKAFGNLLVVLLGSKDVNSDSGILIFDISMPTSPQLLSQTSCDCIQTIYLARQHNRIVKHNNYLYIDNGVILDITNPAKPDLLEEFHFAGHGVIIQGLTKSDDFLLAGSGNNIVKFNLRNPENPEEISSTNIRAEVKDPSFVGYDFESYKNAVYIGADDKGPFNNILVFSLNSLLPSIEFETQIGADTIKEDPEILSSHLERVRVWNLERSNNRLFAYSNYPQVLSSARGESNYKRERNGMPLKDFKPISAIESIDVYNLSNPLKPELIFHHYIDKQKTPNQQSIKVSNNLMLLSTNSLPGEAKKLYLYDISSVME